MYSCRAFAITSAIKEHIQLVAHDLKIKKITKLGYQHVVSVRYFVLYFILFSFNFLKTLSDKQTKNRDASKLGQVCSLNALETKVSWCTKLSVNCYTANG